MSTPIDGMNSNINSIAEQLLVKPGSGNLEKVEDNDNEFLDDTNDPETNEEEAEGDDDSTDSDDDNDADEEGNDDEDEEEEDEDGDDDGDDDDGDEDEEEEDDPQVPVTVNGKQSQVKFSELVKNYQTDAAITQKGQRVAEERKEVEQARALVGRAGQDYSNLLGVVEEFVKKQIEPYSDGDLARLREEDAEAYAQAVDYKNGLKENLNAIVKAKEEEAARAQKNASEAMTQKLNEEANKLVTLIPEAKDKPDEIAETLRKAGTHFGFSEKELSEIADARALNVIYQAYQNVTTKSKDKKLMKKVKTRISKKGFKSKTSSGVNKSSKGKKEVKQSKKVKEAKARFAKNQDTDSLADALLAMSK